MILKAGKPYLLLKDGALTYGCARPFFQVPFYGVYLNLLLFTTEVATMHIKIIPSNQTTSPDTIVSTMETSEHFDIEADSPIIASTPVLAQSVEAVRDKLIASGISEKDVADACAWARRPKE